MAGGCNSSKVASALAANMEAFAGTGFGDDIYTAKGQTPGGRKEYHDRSISHAAKLSDEVGGEIDQAISKDAKGKGKDFKKHAMTLINLTRDPSDIIGPDLIDKIDDLSVAHLKKYRDDLTGKEAQKAYKQVMTEAFSEYEATDTYKNLKDHQKGEYLGYRTYYRDKGGPFSPEEQPEEWLKLVQKGGENFITNMLQSSPTVIVGNVFEGIIKAPALYPKQIGQAVKNVFSKGAWTKYPELDAQGLYGITRPNEGGAIDKASSLIELTDIPLKNILYEAGKLQGGTEAAGRKAVEKVMFQKRLGNAPKLSRTKGRRMLSALTNYTLSSVHLGADIVNRARKGDWAAIAQMVYMIGMVTAIGGTNAIPKEILDLVEVVNPEFADDLREGEYYGGIPGASSAVQFRGPEAFIFTGIIADKLKRSYETALKGAGNVAEGASAGDSGQIMSGLYDFLVEGLLFPVASVSNPSVLGDAQVQKLVRTGKRAMTEQMALDETLEEYGKAFGVIKK